MRKHKTDVMIRMVELYGQYLTVKDEVDAAVEEVTPLFTEGSVCLYRVMINMINS